MLILKINMSCPQCEKGRLERIKRDLEFRYRGRLKVFKQKELFKCGICGYESLNIEEAKQIENELTEFRKSVNNNIDKNPYKEALAYMVDVMSDYDGYDVNNAKLLKKLIDKMVKFAKRKLDKNEGGKMIKFVGKYTTADVMIDEIDETCASQITEIVNRPAFTNQIIIMPDCLTEDTEILTKQGFKPIISLKPDNIIANYNPIDNTIFFKPPKEITIRAMKEGETIYNYSSKQHNFSFEVSENHRMAIKNKMGEIAKNVDKAVMSDLVFCANGIVNENTVSNYSDNDIRIVAWLVGDGNIKVTHNKRSDNYRIRFGLSKKRKIKRVLELLDGEGISYHIGPSSNSSTDIIVNTKYSEKYIGYTGENKKYPLDFILLNRHQADVLINELVMIDGDYEAYKRSSYYRINSNSKYNIDVISAVLSINGYYSKINYRESDTAFGISKLFYVNGIKESKLQCSKSGTPNRKIDREISNYKGNLVCVECDSSFFLARQKGLTFITGNCHAGAGSVIGFTMPLGDKVIPATIGVDIGCGVLSAKLQNSPFSKEELIQLDGTIRKTIPFGYEVHEKNFYNMKKDFPWKLVSEENRAFCLAFNNKFNAEMKPTIYDYEWFEEKCKQINMNLTRAINSVGTLGQGNHFIEIGKSKNTGDFWITIHTGSRQFGSQICKHWQNTPTENRIRQTKLKFKHELALIKAIFIGKARKEIPDKIKRLKAELGLDNKMAKGLDYIDGRDMQGYLTDMIFAQAYAAENRRIILEKIWEIFSPPNTTLPEPDSIESVHNYIDFKDFTIRKGAISAHKNEIVIIPFNMEDGTLICKGLGNEEWNNSAPHGAGRLESRTQAKIKFSADIAKKRMDSKGIFTSVVPVDEVKEAYKDPKIIEEAIKPTVEIIDRLIPIMNLKADE